MPSPFVSKLSAYLGLCLALLLGLVFLYPQKGSFRFEPTHITPVDNDAISLLIQRSTPSLKLLFRVKRYEGKCLPQPSSYGDECNFLELAPSAFDLIACQDDFAQHIPDFTKRLESAIVGDWNDAQIRSLQENAIAVYPKVLARYKADFIIFTVTAHIAFLILLAALIYWRKRVGSLLICAMSAPVKLTFKGAAAAHRNV